MLLAFAAGSFVLGLMTAPGRGQDTKQHGKKIRFDHIVRNDFFAGLTGDREAFARAMRAAEETLKEDPKHAEALVWHGAGLFSQSGQAFQSGDLQRGQEMWEQGLAEMDEAVKLRPDTPATRIPRGSSMLVASRFVPQERKAALLERAVADFSHMYELQKDSLDKLGTHPRGELLMGLADGYDRTGDKEKAKALLAKVVSEMGDTVYGKRAQKWLDTGELPPAQRNCIGCHTPGH
ncbi:hypothetical protein [Paludibaculum fermentans]|uniref:tetratricopeptide repeat protein n=1 Tax=Paludibaculum fermentans TaxID=1473598 RepID=UPI003EB7A316